MTVEADVDDDKDDEEEELDVEAASEVDPEVVGLPPLVDVDQEVVKL